MKNLKVWQTLAILGGLFMLPLAVVFYKMASSISTHNIELARQEARGMEY
jgi:hypothetical protein